MCQMGWLICIEEQTWHSFEASLSSVTHPHYCQIYIIYPLFRTLQTELSFLSFKALLELFIF